MRNENKNGVGMWDDIDFSHYGRRQEKSTLVGAGFAFFDWLNVGYFEN